MTAIFCDSAIVRPACFAYFNIGKVVIQMKATIASLILLVLFSLNSLAQEYTQWHLPADAKLRLGRGEVFDIDYSPDGTQLAVASSIGIWIHDAQNYDEETLFADQTAQVQAIKYTNDGSALISGGNFGGDYSSRMLQPANGFPVSARMVTLSITSPSVPTAMCWRLAVFRTDSSCGMPIPAHFCVR